MQKTQILLSGRSYIRKHLILFISQQLTCIFLYFIDIVNYGSDHELFIAKFRLKLKKVGKTIRPLRYDLNQIPYDYTVQVTNRFKGLDLIECLKNYGPFVTLYR